MPASGGSMPRSPRTARRASRASSGRWSSSARIFIRGLDQTQERAKAARQTLELIAHGGFDEAVAAGLRQRRRSRACCGNGLRSAMRRSWSRPASVAGRETVSTIDIEEWALPDAVRYLLQESGRADLTESDARDIAEALGRLPLALSHAAALLRARAEHHRGELSREPDPADERSAAGCRISAARYSRRSRRRSRRRNARRAAPAR